MCPVKTENLALNVCQAEADFWRCQAAAAHASSRGAFQKNLLLLALERIDRSAARQLRGIRSHYRQFGAAALLALFCLTLMNHDTLRRATRRLREDEITVGTGSTPSHS